jgi:hypothetical protein
MRAPKIVPIAAVTAESSIVTRYEERIVGFARWAKLASVNTPDPSMKLPTSIENAGSIMKAIAKQRKGPRPNQEPAFLHA